ncbi:hypothetical protein GCM10020367_38290 [Streptomyces sannanensis]|uniref:GH26 domain-containing protein n=2 Tax=Streptomyces sannanensis TaxID=285536 RepID=A0ABP6SEY0_9ACTN
MSTPRPMTAAGLLLAALLTTLAGCSPEPLGRDARQARNGPRAEPAVVPHDVRPLIQPGRKYFGAAVAGAPRSMEPVEAYAGMVGKKPNLIETYASWGDALNEQGVRNAWEYGAMTVVSWEPHGTTLADIADGKSDEYIKKYAAEVAELRLPLAISFADEMNGWWNDWGTRNNEPADYVRAWKHIHGLFTEAGAANVIWTWAPNVIQPALSIDLKAYYPGDGYVDWVGLVGYFTTWEGETFDTLFGPTIDAIRTFTRKPLLLLETASEPTEARTAVVRSLFAGVQSRDDVLGFVWFDHNKRADWRLSSTPVALAEFKRLAADDMFGFDVRKP